MTELDLRPLSLGEILDRAFSIYRRHFLLFAGIVALPELLTLALGLLNTSFFRVQNTVDMPGRVAGLAALFDPTRIVLGIVGLVVGIFVYALAQGGTIAAVSEIYLGRTTSIGASLQRAWNDVGSLIGTIFLNGLVTFIALLALVVPGIYVGCRLLVCLPIALIENRGPRDSLSRSWELTSGYAGRSFVMVLIYAAIAIGIGLLIGVPLGMVLVFRQDIAQMRSFLALQQIANVLVSIVVTPLLLIGTAIFYFDLRVRKEGFDLQFMMDPTSESLTRGDSGTPSILS